MPQDWMGVGMEREEGMRWGRVVVAAVHACVRIRIRSIHQWSTLNLVSHGTRTLSNPKTLSPKPNPHLQVLQKLPGQRFCTSCCWSIQQGNCVKQGRLCSRQALGGWAIVIVLVPVGVIIVLSCCRLLTTLLRCSGAWMATTAACMCDSSRRVPAAAAAALCVKKCMQQQQQL